MAEMRRKWVGEWVRSEAFWRDVASRTLAGLIVVAITAAATVLVAWVAAPEVAPIVGHVALGILVAMVCFALILFVGALLARVVNAWSSRHPDAATWQVTLVAFALVAVWLAVAGLLFWGAQVLGGLVSQS